MTVSDRVFQILEEKCMTQKEFSEKTGIPQSTISDWRKKRTNPASDKIMVICSVLSVTPEWLLSGVKGEGNRANSLEWYAIHRDSEVGKIIELYNEMTRSQRDRLMGYIEACVK
ncbi:helix-turn-helix domain-containing protein [Butyrivibrio sp. INlla14]|uniref:helix-turn-helix domain-containing protein n=1 Tax=Butyrivibrio sp. INlla14 TaxID=1520808 RepID=UPI000876751B|nr:helix-turn-helix transcriptional regulator [Butyrivibrio sp. INlla14]SCY74219.1 Transcriptional regulator, contains XRE-family HTH domain [Butyrivibrio sp. INlla14]